MFGAYRISPLPGSVVCALSCVLVQCQAVMSCEEEEESSMDEDEDMPGLESVSSSEVKSAPLNTV